MERKMRILNFIKGAAAQKTRFRNTGQSLGKIDAGEIGVIVKAVIANAGDAISHYDGD